MNAPAPYDSVEALEDHLSTPPPSLLESFARVDGDIVLLGVGGKMGPTMARMAKRASEQLGVERRVIGVSRFSDAAVRERLEGWGVETQVADLLDEEQLAALPDAANVVFMSGFKFGAAANPSRAWAMNCYAPALCCRRFRGARVTAFSSGNVYPFTDPATGGSRVSDPPAPVGEYAWTALGRERMFQFFSRELQTPLTLLRLNYATELRYGVLVDLALAVRDAAPVDVSMSHVNVLWLGDANAMTLQALTLDHPDDRVINMAGAEILNTANVCRRFGELLDCEPNLVGEESATALLNDGREGYADLGRPQVDAATMIQWTAEWVKAEQPLLNKPTHFAVRNGAF